MENQLLSNASTKLPKALSISGNSAENSAQLYAFSPNRETLGGTAYLLRCEGFNILVDCPTWSDANRDFLQAKGGIQWLVISHRGGGSQVKKWQTEFNCRVVVQEQEAYLLPQVEVTPFHQQFMIDDQHRLLWTPGHSPGSACLYSTQAGGILFTGRHLLPNRQGQLVPLRVSKTFHWPRQLRSTQRLLQEFTAQTLKYGCPGANTGFLRGKGLVENAYDAIASLDFEQLKRSQPLL